MPDLGGTANKKGGKNNRFFGKNHLHKEFCSTKLVVNKKAIGKEALPVAVCGLQGNSA